MKKNISILGSTGSIGKSLLKIIDQDKKNFKIILLTSNKSHTLLFNQAKKFNVKNLIITNKKNYLILKNKTKNTNIQVYNNFDSFKKIFKKKVDYTMSSISGIVGLEPTIKIIKYSKMIAIANKESIICGWNLIVAELKKNNTKFIPVDSEHFSIWHSIANSNRIANSNSMIDKIFLTASGGACLHLPINKLQFVKPQIALKHPNWKMGKKITIDSATLMNKVFETIEAKNIFNVVYDKIDILIHSKSYLHAIIKFSNGITNMIIHDTSMKIPIFNTLYPYANKSLVTKKLDVTKINKMNLKKVDPERFPSITVLKYMPKKFSLLETVLVCLNDEFVDLFLKNKIRFTDISKLTLKFLKLKEFKKYRSIQPKKIEDIINIKDYIHFKIKDLSI